MSQEDLIRYPFLPVSGLDLSEADDRLLTDNPLRFSYGVRPKGAEIWSREGVLYRRYSAVGLPFATTVSLDLIYGTTTTTRHFLIANWGVAEISVSDWSLSVPYSAEWTGTIDYVNGSATATVATKTSGAGTTIPVDSLLVAKDNDGLNTIYRVTARSAANGNAGTTLTLHRVYQHTTAAGVAANIYARPGSASLSADDIAKCSWTVFRQRVTFAAGAVWNDGATTSPYYTEQSPALTAGDLLFVMCAGVQDSGVPRGPFAFKLNTVAAPIFDLHRKTANSITAATAFSGSAIISRHIATFRGRLLVRRCDEFNENAGRTVWYSEDGNLLYWHTGAVGQNANHNYIKLTDGNEPITSLRALADRMVIHRRRGFAALIYRNTEIDPFEVDYRNDGVGFLSGTVVDIDGAQIGWSEHGPALFDGDRYTLLDERVRGAARYYGGTIETTLDPVVHSTYHLARHQIWWRVPNGAFFLVYDLRTNGLYRISQASSSGGLGTFRLSTGEVVISSDGNGGIRQHTQTNKAKDSGASYGASDASFTANFRTRWHAPYNYSEATLLKLQIELRGVPGSSAYPDYVTEFLQSGSGSDFTFTIVIYTDKRTATAVATVTATASYVDLVYPAAGNIDGDDYGPIGTYILVPITKISKSDGSLVTGETFRIDFSSAFPFRVSQIIGFFRPSKTTRRERDL